MEGLHGDPRQAGRAEPSADLGGDGAIEGEDEDLVLRDGALLDEVADAALDDAGLAAAGGGDDEGGVLHGDDGFELLASEGSVLGEGGEARLLGRDEGGVRGVDQGLAAGGELGDGGEARAQVRGHPRGVLPGEEGARLLGEGEPGLGEAVRDVAGGQALGDRCSGLPKIVRQLGHQQAEAGFAVLFELPGDLGGLPRPGQANRALSGAVGADELDAAE